MPQRTVLAAAVLLLALASQAAEPAKRDGDPWVGVWYGQHTAIGHGYRHLIKVEKTGVQYFGLGLTWHAMSEEQAQAALMRQLRSTDVSANAICAQQDFEIIPEERDNVVSFRAGRARLIFHGLVYNPDVFIGDIVAPGIVAGKAKDSRRAQGFFRLWKEGALEKARPAPIGSGKVESLACLEDKGFHYTCYVPKGYDPKTPVPVLVNFSPEGNAQPLSTRAAEEAGWIMAGLSEARGGPDQAGSENRDAVLFDLRRRFNINWKRVYFSGLGDGALAAAEAARNYAGMCAGLICIGAAYGAEPLPKEQAVFLLAGQTDPSRREAENAHRAGKALGRKSELVIHPGGHDWGRAEDHEAAVRWLEKETGAKPAADTKKKP